MPTKITPAEAVDLIWATERTIFTVEFIKRTTGELRKMRAVRNYKSLLVGGEAAYNAIDYKLLVVRDLDKGAIRSIPVDAIVRITTRGEDYEVTK